MGPEFPGIQGGLEVVDSRDVQFQPPGSKLRQEGAVNGARDGRTVQAVRLNLLEGGEHVLRRGAPAPIFLSFPKPVNQNGFGLGNCFLASATSFALKEMRIVCSSVRRDDSRTLFSAPGRSAVRT